MHRELKQFIAFAIGFLLAPIVTLADGTAKLSWNANTEADLGGYRIHYGRSSGKYDTIVNVGNLTAKTIDNLTGGATYYFAVSALDNSGNESRPSAEVSLTIPAATLTPLSISAVAAANFTASSATITWTTSAAATSQVEYGPDANYGSVSALDSDLATAHAVSLSGLSPNTLYHFRVKSTDASSQVAVSQDYTFQTAVAALVDGTVNLSLGKPAVASSSVGERTPDKAVDDIISTYWRNSRQGNSQTAWLCVDLQSLQTVSRAVIKWRSGYFAKKYEIQFSNDGKKWQVAHANDEGRRGKDEVTFPAVSARYVRLFMTQMNKTSYRVNALELYASDNRIAQNGISQEDDRYELDESEELEDDDAIAPNSFTLHQNYPNPFNPRTEIKFDLKTDGHVVLKIYNSLGQVVRTLYDGQQAAGLHRVAWDARNDHGQLVPSGTYLYTLEIKEEMSAGNLAMSSTLARQSRTMTLLK